MTLFYAMRYFQIVPIVPPLFIAAFAVAVASAALRLMSNPSSAGAALIPVLLLQLFAASSGFKFAARRGYYDLLLTSGTPRWQIALAHCLISILPGLASWLCIALMELAANRGSCCLAAAPGTCAAVLSSSLLAWSVAVFSSRTATAVVWLLVLTICAGDVMSPLTLLGTISTGPLAVGGGCAAALMAFGAAMAFIVRGTTPLEAAQ